MPPTKHDDPARLIYLRPGETDAEYRARMGYSPATPKSTIHKDHSPSVVDRVSVIAKGLGAYAASKYPFSFENKRDAALDEYKKWKTEHPHASAHEIKAKFDEYNQKVQELRRKHGGKKKSRKSRKSGKSKSRKNRKTRSRK
jgi:hypothetical protein